MLRKMVLTAILLLALPVACVTVYGQNYTDVGLSSDSPSFTEVGFYSRNCGRGITTGQAAALWAGYCNEDCSYHGDGCGYGGCGIGVCGIGLGKCWGRGKGCGLLKRRDRGCGHGSGFDCSCGDCGGGYASTHQVGYVDDCAPAKRCRLRNHFAKYKNRDGCGSHSGCRLGRIFHRGHGGCGSCYQSCLSVPAQVVGVPMAVGSTDPNFCDCGGCQSSCRHGGKCKHIVAGIGRGVFGAARKVVGIPFGIARKICSGCGHHGRNCGCGGGLFKSAIGRVGCCGYDGGFFYDSPANFQTFNLCTSGCGTVPTADAVQPVDAASSPADNAFVPPAAGNVNVTPSTDASLSPPAPSTTENSVDGGN